MKQLLLLSLCMLVALSTTSCQKNEDTNNNDNTISGCPPPPVVGRLMDGGGIYNMDLFCVENQRPPLIELGVGPSEYYAMTKTVKDYSSFKLYVMLSCSSCMPQTNDRDLLDRINTLCTDYGNKRSAFIVDDYNHHNIQTDPVGWPNFFTAFTNGEVSITCDKTLYGELPGTNLSKYITVFSDCYCLPIGKENSRLLYRFAKDIPTQMDKYFVEGIWLQPEYFLTFTEQPSERYDELTLSISIPMTREHFTSYVVAQCKGEQIDMRYSDITLDAKCTIKFDWE